MSVNIPDLDDGLEISIDEETEKRFESLSEEQKEKVTENFLYRAEKYIDDLSKDEDNLNVDEVDILADLAKIMNQELDKISPKNPFYLLIDP